MSGKTVDQLGPVAAPDGQLWLVEKRLPDRHLSLVALAVYDPDARRRDGDVVDVPASAGYAPVMKDDDLGVAVRGEPPCNSLLTPGATRPRALMPGLVLKPEDETAQPRMPLADALLAVRPPAGVLRSRARAGGAAVKIELFRAVHLARFGKHGAAVNESSAESAGGRAAVLD